MTDGKEKVEKFKYLQVTPRDKSWGLAVTTAALQENYPFWLSVWAEPERRQRQQQNRLDFM